MHQTLGYIGYNQYQQHKKSRGERTQPSATADACPDNNKVQDLNPTFEHNDSLQDLH